VTFDVQIAHGVEEIGEEAWNHLSGDRPFASYRWYRFGEAVLADDLPIYVILSRQGEAVGRATFWLERRESLPVRSRVVHSLVRMVLRWWPLLVCRSPLSGTSGLVLPAPPSRDAALETIIRCAQELTQQYGVSFLLFDYLEHAEMSWPGWPQDLVRVASMDPGTCLAISWPDFEGYLAHLSKKHRYNIRRNYRLAAEQGIEVKYHRTVVDVDQAMRLHENVNRRYRYPTDPWMRGVLENAGMVNAAWLAAEQEGRIVGCELMVEDGKAWLVMGLGLDYATPYVYFLLGHEDIRYAIDHGACVLRWGASSYEVKQRFGFQPEDNGNLVFAGRWASLQSLGRWVAEHNLA